MTPIYLKKKRLIYLKSVVDLEHQFTRVAPWPAIKARRQCPTFKDTTTCEQEPSKCSACCLRQHTSKSNPTTTHQSIHHLFPQAHCGNRPHHSRPATRTSCPSTQYSLPPPHHPRPHQQPHRDSHPPLPPPHLNSQNARQSQTRFCTEATKMGARRGGSCS